MSAATGTDPWLPGAPPGDAELRALAGSILEREEYAQWRTSAAQGLDELVAWLLQKISWLGVLSQAEPLLYWSIMVGVSLLAVALIAHVIWSIRVAIRASTPRESAARDVAALPDFVAQAERLAAGGDFLEAARRLQLAVLQLLVERGFVELARHEPNRVLRQRLSDADELPEATRSELRERIGELERSWFRERRGDRALYEGWSALHARLDALGPVASRP